MNSKITLKTSFFLFIVWSAVSAQSLPRDEPKSVYEFVKHLYCEGDYLRASLESLRLKEIAPPRDSHFVAGSNFPFEDSVNFILGKSYQNLSDYENSSYYFLKFFDSNSPLKEVAAKEYIKTKFLQWDKLYLDKNFSIDEGYHLLPFYYIYKLLSELKSFNCVDPIEKLKKVEDPSAQLFIAENCAKLNSLEYKSPLTAGIFSAIIPGSGKIYTHNYSDGIMSFLLTALFGYLAYDNFKANHDFRGGLFAAIGTFFYAGSIYGSIISAKIFNKEAKEKFVSDLFDGLRKNNYFIDEVNFCK